MAAFVAKKATLRISWGGTLASARGPCLENRGQCHVPVHLCRSCPCCGRPESAGRGGVAHSVWQRCKAGRACAEPTGRQACAARRPWRCHAAAIGAPGCRSSLSRQDRCTCHRWGEGLSLRPIANRVLAASPPRRSASGLVSTERVLADCGPQRSRDGDRIANHRMAQTLFSCPFAAAVAPSQW